MNFMKNILTVFLCLLLLEAESQHGPFLRVYNSQGQKFAKGHLQKTTDSGIIIVKKGKELEEIKYSFIHKIRMRRSAGMTGLIVGGIPVMWGASLINRDQNWDGLVGALLVLEGMVIGPSASGLKALLNPKPLMVLGDRQKWIEAKKKLDQKLLN